MKLKGKIISSFILVLLFFTTSTSYIKADNSLDYNKLTQDGWFKYDDEYWMFKKEDGMPAIGWLNYKNHWYYFNGNGGLVYNTARTIGSKLYYFNSDGTMSTKIGFYEHRYFNGDGTIKSGWFKYNNKWYHANQDSGYLNENGAYYINYKWYYFNKDFTMTTNKGWIHHKEVNPYSNKSFSTWYFSKGDGTIATDWYKTGDRWYYFGATKDSHNLNSLEMYTGFKYIDGKLYYFYDNGWMCYKTGWIQNDDGKWYYLNGDGTVKTGWLKTGGRWYYFGEENDPSKQNSLEMYTGFRFVDEKLYYFYDNGWMCYKTGWIQNDDGWHYLNGDGTVRTGWLKNDNKWYYFDGHGNMLCDTKCKVDNKLQSFDKSGVWIG
ncbi:hypothetical protein CHF27_010855 [Romboutsia maritimum]|uniref:Cell wall-binding protein n=1 Tax=Romboutsia maritimum TaxID=2020948 RepID=A0A371IR00_9FIRM|nr:hypothetical protein [Romboutsia maritimum]RDY22910.1 hypothetical protein CHF27_010855 [Romboutsia maritimum]